MLEISEKEVVTRFKIDNPWWGDAKYHIPEADFHRRAYFNHFFSLVMTPVRRAIILMGPRRVGKTVMMKQAIAALLRNHSVTPTNVLYMSLETPIFTGVFLEKFLWLFMEQKGFDKNASAYVFFDEIQYLKDWALHLKSLVDAYPNIRFVVSGSAAAALKMKSTESGAGRFSDFLLPPLNFLEYVAFSRGQDLETSMFSLAAYDNLNKDFIDYLNFGGFPEAVLNPAMRLDAEQFVRSDIIDKVLLKDLPELYGIGDTQELNRLFSVLAYNTGREISLRELESESKITKNPIKKYLEYLEAAFLITKLSRIDQNAKRMKKEHSFKIYLTNPCLRTAIFGPVDRNHPHVGHLVETAVLHHLKLGGLRNPVRYARWDKGEIDFVLLDSVYQRPESLIEVTWSDKKLDEKVKLLESFALNHKIEKKTLLTYSKATLKEGRLTLPVSLWCLMQGINEFVKQSEWAADTKSRAEAFWGQMYPDLREQFSQ